MPDKQQAWNDLIKLIANQDSNVRLSAVDAIFVAFSEISDKQHAWNDLIKLITDQENHVKYGAARAIASAFFHAPDKQKVGKPTNYN